MNEVTLEAMEQVPFQRYHGSPAQAVQPTGWLSWTSTAPEISGGRGLNGPRLTISAADRNARQGQRNTGGRETIRIFGSHLLVER